MGSNVIPIARARFGGGFSAGFRRRTVTRPVKPPRPSATAQRGHYRRACVAYEMADEWNLTPAQIAVLLYVAHHDMGAGAWPKLETIMEATRYSRLTVRRALLDLKGLGLIKRDGRKNRCWIWRLADDFHEPT